MLKRTLFCFMKFKWFMALATLDLFCCSFPFFVTTFHLDPLTMPPILICPLPLPLFFLPDSLSLVLVLFTNTQIYCTSNSKVWDTYTGDILASFPHQHIVRGCDFSGDGSRIVTGGMEKKLRIFDLNRDDLAGQPILSADGHTSVIRNVVWDGARNMILSSGDDMEIR